jgi:glycosyltransferase involved in cell wall biosynthesis
LPLFKRGLFSLVKCPPPCPFEVVIADDGSADDILGMVRETLAGVPWTFVRLDKGAFERETGVRPYYNCPAWSNNVAFRHSRGEAAALQGNDIIVRRGVYDGLLRRMAEREGEGKRPLILSSCYDMPRHLLARLTEDGDNLTDTLVRACEEWPLQSVHLQCLVTNYVSVCPRSLWEEVGGYNEEYLRGVSCEDSDFVRRVRAVPGGLVEISEGTVVHQNHGGKSRYQEPLPSVISRGTFYEGCRINRALYDGWDGSPKNTQPWEWGKVGVVEVIRSWE